MICLQSHRWWQSQDSNLRCHTPDSIFCLYPTQYLVTAFVTELAGPVFSNRLQGMFKDQTFLLPDLKKLRLKTKLNEVKNNQTFTITWTRISGCRGCKTTLPASVPDPLQLCTATGLAGSPESSWGQPGAVNTTRSSARA